MKQIKQNRGKLSHGVAPSHTVVAKAAMVKVGFELAEHPPSSPDLAPSNYRLFKIKKTLT